MNASDDSPAYWLDRRELQRLIDALQQAGYDVIGPTIDETAIVYDSIDSVDQLPQGWSDQQSPASYHLLQAAHDRCFFFNSTPDSWKKYLYPARQELAGAKLTDRGWEFATAVQDPPPRAFLGVRACDLAAIQIQDRVFLQSGFVDPVYDSARKSSLIVAVNCSTAASTCFCTSMDTGPRCGSGYDIVLTETEDGFVVETGSEGGRAIIDALQLQIAAAEHLQAAAAETERARQAIQRDFHSAGLRDLLMSNLEHARWNDVAQRCLSCSNCTMVCPTCFCATIDEVSDLDQTEVTRVRQWDSCFSFDFSYTAGGTVRDSVRSRFRQWATHKFATWQDQFDTSGCTGCGRCITWCPVGIDVTEEIDAIGNSATSPTK
ncbi:MAG: 4Fe-4S dicluster domain-containing protein [Pirellulales bacterium]|nr:4Fe-4S dicluster domain-containing protein [Pirellulales bacterium]